jgi:hypothetical protein
VVRTGSTNEKIRVGANSALDALTAALEPSSLVQNFSHCLNHAGVRAKQIMLAKLTTIVPEVRPPSALRSLSSLLDAPSSGCTHHHHCG